MPGKFVWFDLNTPNPDAALPFYKAVVGWDIELWEQADPPYPMWKTPAGSTIGGVRPLPEQAAASGAPPHWISYIETADVEATVAKATTLGAQVLMPLMAIPTVGSFAVLADPQGAVFCPFQPQDSMDGDDARATRGEVSWIELNTSDHEAAWAFYSAVFGWEVTSTMDMGPELGEYRMFGFGEKTLGGMCTLPASTPSPPSWLPYFNVPDADAATRVATDNGATIVNGPMDVPGGDRVSHMLDPQGAQFAVHSFGG